MSSGRTRQELEQDVVNMWQLASELSEQLTKNKEMLDALTTRAREVQGQAIHTGVGFPLRRYNTDLSTHEFESELEKFASHLVLENQMLLSENKQLGLLVKEFEQTLEGVMGKFRGVAHASTQHDLSLHTYYTTLLNQLQLSHSQSTLLDSTTLSTLLTRLSTLVRAALRSVNGEDIGEEEEEGLLKALKGSPGGHGNGTENARSDLENLFEIIQGATGKQAMQTHQGGVRTSLSPPPTSSFSSTAESSTIHGLPTGSTGSPNSTSTHYSPSSHPIPTSRSLPWLGDIQPSGGYTSTPARADWALEREEEIIRLEEENRGLRGLLADVEAIESQGIEPGEMAEKETEMGEQEMVGEADVIREEVEHAQDLDQVKDTSEEEEKEDKTEPTEKKEEIDTSIVQGFKVDEPLSSTLPESAESSTTSSAPAAESVSSSALPSTLSTLRDKINSMNPRSRSPIRKTSSSTRERSDSPDSTLSPPQAGKASAATAPPPLSSASSFTFSTRSTSASSSPHASPRGISIPTPSSPSLSRSQTTPQILKSPRSSKHMLSLSPTSGKSTIGLPSSGSPGMIGSRSPSLSKDGNDSDKSSSSTNSLASIFLKPKTDPTTATSTALELGFDHDNLGSPSLSTNRSREKNSEKDKDKTDSTFGPEIKRRSSLPPAVIDHSDSPQESAGMFLPDELSLEKVQEVKDKKEDEEVEVALEKQVGAVSDGETDAALASAESKTTLGPSEDKPSGANASEDEQQANPVVAMEEEEKAVGANPVGETTSVEEATDNIKHNQVLLRFDTLTSHPSPSFWSTLTTLKLDKMKLDDTPRQITGYLEQGRRVVDREAKAGEKDEIWIGGSIGIDGNSLEAEDGQEPPSSTVALQGTFKNYNTIEEFKNPTTKKALFDKVVSDLVASHPSPSISPSYNPFLLLSFADLKKYKYHYQFAFPVVLQKVGWEVDDETTENDGESQSVPLMKEWTGDMDAILAAKVQAGVTEEAFLVKSKTQNAAAEGDGGEYEVGQVKDWSQFYEGVKEDQRHLMFHDPSSLSDLPGWTLRNILFYLSTTHNVRSLKVISLRSGKQGVRWFQCRLPVGKEEDVGGVEVEVKTVSGDVGEETNIAETGEETQGKRWKAVGWERNEKGALAAKVADLGSTMDPKKLADQAIDLNLKLMKWRVMPNLDLDKIANTKCLLLGAGTLGCYVARCLMGWGIRNITFVDSATVSFSNPVRQPLFEFEDCLEGGKPKAQCAADSLKRIFPGVNAQGIDMRIPMPGHPISPSSEPSVRASITELEQLIASHDAIFLLMDSRESRWLPTVIGASQGKIVMNAALGFDSWVVMRHGVKLEGKDGEDGEDEGEGKMRKLGCYYCNDVVAPTDSITDRSLDQMCTVTRPGVAPIAAATAVELLISLLQHKKGVYAPADLPAASGGSVKDPESVLGMVPHQLRGFLAQFKTMMIEGSNYDRCTGCSDIVLDAYRDQGFDMLRRAFNEGDYLEKLTGLDKVQEEGEAAMEAMDEWDDDDDDDDDDEKERSD